ncbi:ferrous iron transport protein B [Paenibacillus sambharensis]|uniref:Ferrous iron transport protein B n=1 Tax=Paenibacillus sambharensis TaxID=1803190 RepID=A0A2W1LEH1_9BACL|nr:ferrous iron transport protein B [Paenibacillus sambharensis]PZD97476.1 ferrous iron transport protein B [Paenibacillus sambharensis]
MVCHTVTKLPIKKTGDEQWIALVGNPNVGKSVVFHKLTNLYVDVSNFPGTTLDIHHGKFGEAVLIDTPGVYGISSFSEEERITRDVVLAVDKVINVVNACHLERDLFLTQQLIDMGIPMVVVINMVDEAERRGLIIDVDQLTKRLGVAVITAVATRGRGIAEIIECIRAAPIGHALPVVAESLKNASPSPIPTKYKLLVLEGDEGAADFCGVTPGSLLETLYEARRGYIDSIINECVADSMKGASMGTRLGRYLLRPWIGIPFLVLVLYAMYLIIGVFVAGDIVGITEEQIMIGYYEPAVVYLFTEVLGIPADHAMGEILVGEFGLFTMTFIYVLGLLLPLVCSFYLFLSLFEDSGYLPRLAAMVDRLMQSIGLNGKAIIPFILGFGCVTMATITTRMLGNEKEKRIAVFLLGLAIPCSAQLAVIVSLLAGVGIGYILIYGVVILLVLGIVGTLMDRLLKGSATSLLLDLPPLRVPRLSNVMKKTATKTYHFLKEALPLFALGSILISLLNVTGMLKALSALLRPVTVDWLGLPAEASQAFIMGIVRRDFGAAGLSNMNLAPSQVIVALITITLFVPCIASILVLFKERTRKEAAAMWASTFAVAFTVGGLVNHILKRMSDASQYVQLGVVLVVMLLIGYALRQAAVLWQGLQRGKTGYGQSK